MSGYVECSCQHLCMVSNVCIECNLNICPLQSFIKCIYCNQNVCTGCKIDHINKHTRFKRMKPLGIANVGFSCYMSVALQCLGACSILSNYIINNSFDDTLLNEYKGFVNSLFNEETNEPYIPANIKKEVGLIDEEFKDSKQKDCYQFMSTLLNELNTRLSDEENQTFFQSRALGRSISLDEAIAEGISKALGVNSSLTSNLFTVMAANIIRCKKCSNKRIKLESSFSLSLPIPSKKSPLLSDCLMEYLNVQQLTGNNLINCAVCNEKVEGESYMQLVHLPPYLLLYFKKQKLKKLNVTEKTQVHVEYPTAIDFTELMANSNSTYILDSISKRPPKYRLLGIVFHMGNIDEGHYTCLIRRCNAWYYCDDSKVKAVSKEEFVKSNNEVILLYEREGIDSIISKESC